MSQGDSEKPMDRSEHGEAPPDLPAYKEGDQVHARSDRSRVGSILSAKRAGGTFWYEVQFPDRSTRHYPESDLGRFDARLDAEGLFASGSFGDEEDLIRFITFHKLDTPLDNVLYSLEASRTEFHPHQYKPLVKFLDSRSHRLLIADEVGLGKTIEAGIILAEQRARRALNQALVVCPAALSLKWQEEMWKRFDEEFRIYSSEEFREVIERYHRIGELGEIRGIIALQSLRQRKNMELLEASPLPVDLLIVDEAHHLRNRSTLSHKVVRDMADQATAVLLLTATPIQLGTENLFHLLQILDPGEFEEFSTFESRLRANVPVVEAERLLRSSFPPPSDEILSRFRALREGSAAQFFNGNPLLKSVEERFGDGRGLSRKTVVRINEDLKDLNLLSHIFSRSRKREVFPNAPERTAPVLGLTAEPEELEFYWAVTEFVRSLHEEGGGNVPFLVAVQAQRQVASCMQAAKGVFVGRALDAALDPEMGDLDWDLDSEPNQDADEAERLSPPDRVLAAALSLGSTDSKLKGLLEALADLDQVEPNRKVLLFSFFKRTLDYLKEKLEEAGYPCELISGDVKSNPRNPEQDERGRRMRRFRDPDSGVRILLSSEVGSEGLDFQFANVMVNYDLPWNPMRVEQRIGRLDRMGQKADRIIIFNLYLPDTIEDRILRRLHVRIGIFKESIGDLETILGDEIQRLSRDLLTNHLTPEEEEARIDQAADAIELRLQQFKRLNAESPRFVGHDQYFVEQLERARQGGELLSPKDLEAFFRRFMERHHPRSKLKKREESGRWELLADSSLENEIRAGPSSPLTLRFLHRIRSGSVEITFRADAAYLDDEVQYLGPHHPLMQAAAEHYRRQPEELHAVSAVRLEESKNCEPGVYLYGLFEVGIKAGAERKRLEPFFLVLPSGEALDPESGSALLGEMLRRGEGWKDLAIEPGPELIESLASLKQAFLQRIAEERQEMMARNLSRVQTRLASLRSSHEVRIGVKKRLLREAESTDKSDNYLRMLRGTVRNMEAQFRQRKEEIEDEREVELSFNLIGCGLLTVEGRHA